MRREGDSQWEMIPNPVPEPVPGIGHTQRFGRRPTQALPEGCSPGPPLHGRRALERVDVFQPNDFHVAELPDLE